MEYIHELIVAHPWLLAFWIFVIGSAIGSFLNVVIYRLPRGMSLSRPGSHCPKCGHAIRWYHNLPIVGWLFLRGKCFDCKAAISPRYPLVEVLVAVLFVALAYFDIYRPALQNGSGATEIDHVNMHVGASTLAFAAHAWLACSVLAAAIIRRDGQPVPWKLIVPALIVVAAAAPFLDRFRAGWLLLAAAILVCLKFVPANKKPPASAGG